MLNAQSNYAHPKLERGGSYFQRMVHRDTEELVAKILEFVDGSRNYVLGIESETLVERTDPATAAVTAVDGSPTQ